jgi:hypothetical protein
MRRADAHSMMSLGRLKTTTALLDARDSAGENWVVGHQIVDRSGRSRQHRCAAPPDRCKNCDQPQPPNVTEAIADRERDR